MPNNCLSIFKIVGKREDISDLFHKLYTLWDITSQYHNAYIIAHKEKKPLPVKPPEVLHGGSHLDLCDIVNYFGGDADKIDCRGYVETFEFEDENTIKICTDTAYNPMQEVWATIIVGYESLKYFFVSDEIGSGCFYNNDTTGEHFSDKYFIDNNFGNETEVADSDEFLLHYMSQWLEVGELTNLKELDIWLQIFNEENPDDTLNYYPYILPNPCIPNLSAVYRKQSQRLRLYHNNKCILDESGVEDYEDMDYWNSIEYRGDTYDINLHIDGDGKHSLCLYPVIDGSADYSVCQQIKLK